MSNPTGGETLATLDRQLAKFEDLLNIVAAFFILALMFFGAAQVISRKLLNYPLWGYIDIVEIGMVTFAFLAISSCQRLGGHIRMEILVRRLSGRSMWIFEFIGVVVALAIMLVLVWYAFDAFMRALQLGDSTIDRELVTWPSKMLVPFAFTVLIARLMLQIWGYWRLILHPDAKPIAVPLLADVIEQAQKEIKDTFGDDAPGPVQGGNS